jgi:dTDP-4-dehydrorhamnose reductase
MARVALIGSNGQLGSDIARLWQASELGRRGDQLIGLVHADIEVTDEMQVRSILSGIQPSLVINTSAFHRVDDCESDPLRALEVNGLGVKYLAESCRELGAVLLHVSTDYVFGGDSTVPYTEADAALPVSAYGISKVAGEQYLRYLMPEDHILIRSSGLYGVAGASGKGGNFVETMLRFAREGRPIRVVNDQVSAPTYTLDLAETMLEVIARGGRGTYHITNAGECSWYAFAQEIFTLVQMTPDLAPTTSADYGAAALRPAYSVLENSRLKALGLSQPRPWQSALASYLQLKGHRLAA